jgi:pimeloyl-ACP methyl ester carboxylesterase
MMTQEVAQRIKINGADLDVRDRGSGEPVVFVHGGMGDECAAVVKEPALISKYRVIDYHRRGWGNSSNPEPPVSMKQQAADCRAIMRRLGVERAHLAGLSYGGAVVLQLTRDNPEVVHSLALMEPALPSVLFAPGGIGEVFEKVVGMYESGDKDGAIETFAIEVGGADFRETFAKTLPPGFAERWLAAADTMLQGEVPLAEWSFTGEDAARIRQPVFNMMGANTRPYFREVYETVREWFPQAQSVVLPNANHGMLQTNPPGAAEHLASFFSRHPLQG